MYHVELRQFPHNFCRFNLTERELRESILDGWARGEWIEVGERKWNSHQASLTVLQGPELPVQQLSMGRGWRNALRKGSDVTEQLLASVRAQGTEGLPRIIEPMGTPEQAAPSGAEERKPADEVLARELLASLGRDSGPLVRAWQLALERHPDRTPSECLALAEDFVRR
jgi:hypothetical protein